MSVQEFKQAVLAGRYPEAQAAGEGLTPAALRDALVTLAFDEASLSTYAFAAWRATSLGTAAAHLLASEVAAMALSHIPGAYPAGFHHARQAVELAPTDVEALAQLLFFHGIPGPLLDGAEAEHIARRILAIDPKRAEALKVVDAEAR